MLVRVASTLAVFADGVFRWALARPGLRHRAEQPRTPFMRLSFSWLCQKHDRPSALGMLLYRHGHCTRGGRSLPSLSLVEYARACHAERAGCGVRLLHVRGLRPRVEGNEDAGGDVFARHIAVISASMNSLWLSPSCARSVDPRTLKYWPMFGKSFCANAGSARRDLPLRPRLRRPESSNVQS
jgi:hypothetical protein